MLYTCKSFTLLFIDGKTENYLHLFTAIFFLNPSLPTLIEVTLTPSVTFKHQK